MSADLPRFFVAGRVLGDRMVGSGIHLEESLSRQLCRVLRLKAGQRIVLLDGTGEAFEAELRSVDPAGATAVLVGPASSAPEPAVRVTLLSAVLKGDRQEWLVQKAVELGVWRIQPILTERGVALAQGAKPDRWRRIAREAAEQCERPILPDVCDPIPLSASRWPAGRALACTERGGEPIVSRLSHDDRELTLLVGPEGGWSPAELAWLADRGAVGVSLGPRILRAETASLAALSVVMAHHCPGRGSVPSQRG